ncbi:MAG: hypothetical protein ACRDIZ_09010 [Actinomycetota bacterium]
MIFDKSTLQSLSLDESVWLENFFLTNITPIFFVETLADLSKAKTKRGGPSLVAELARKTPTGGSFPNGFHFNLVGNDLVGNTIPMSNQAVLLGGVNKVDPRGQVETHFDEFDEAAALARWQEGKFDEIEQRLAKAWRELLTNVDFRALTKRAKEALGIDKVGSLEEGKAAADEFVKGAGESVVRFTRVFLGIGPQWEEEILKRYSESGDMPLEEFAPYAGFVLKINLFFHLAMGSSLIAKERPSNMVDISYLFYLPFCHVFASSDRLHERTAPLFCEHGQEFVWGADLKAALQEINQFYSQYEDEIERVGIIRFAPYPPVDLDNAVTRLWDKFAPRWREAKSTPEVGISPENAITPEVMAEIADKSTPIPQDAVGPEPKYAMFRRRMPIRRGRWRLLPPEVEKG